MGGASACYFTSNEIVKMMKQHPCSSIHVAITVIGRQMILLFYAYNCRMGAIAYAYLAIVHVRRVSWGASYQDEDE